MKLQLQEYKTRGTVPPISYKPDPTVGMKPKTKSDYLKVDIKTQKGEIGSEKVSFYVTVFNTGSPES